MCIDVYVIEESPFFARVGYSCFAQSSGSPWAASGETLGYLPTIFGFPLKHFFAEPFDSANERTRRALPSRSTQAYSCSQEMARFSRGGARGDGFQGVRQAPGPAYASSQPFYPPMG